MAALNRSRTNGVSSAIRTVLCAALRHCHPVQVYRTRTRRNVRAARPRCGDERCVAARDRLVAIIQASSVATTVGASAIVSRRRASRFRRGGPTLREEAVWPPAPSVNSRSTSTSTTSTGATRSTCDNCGVTLEVISLNPHRTRCRARRRRRGRGRGRRRGRSRRGRGRGRGRGRRSRLRPPAPRPTDDPLAEKEARAPPGARRDWARSSWRSAAAPTAPTSRAVATDGAGRPRARASPPTAPATRRGTARSPLRLARDFSLRHEFIATGEMDESRVPRQRAGPLLLLQAGAVHAA
ncbi:MAG: hypothetical protein MZU84_04555 [Sphingobacterium sp.]|nr:hypothetical protein [Sphingobacterium sp.]